MANEVTINVPAQLLPLAKVCSDSMGRLDLDQLRVGWDVEGPWAAATDSRVCVQARWHPDVRDTPAPVGTEFGVRAEHVRRVAKLAAKKPGRWAPSFTAFPGGLSIARGFDPDRAVYEVAGPLPGPWLKPDQLARTIGTARAAFAGEPRRGMAAAPCVLAAFNRFLAAFGRRAEYDAVVRVSPAELTTGGGTGSVGGWAFEVGEHREGHLDYGVRLWAAVACFKQDLKEWRGVAAPAPAGGDPFAAELGGEGG